MDKGRKISFYSDAAHNYMVLECPPGLKENYQYKMLAANRISGLLDCSGRSIDSREYLYYDISSRQSLADLYDSRPVRGGDLNRILKNLVKVEETLTEYLLDTSHLILVPECVYLDFREQACGFVYYPGEEQQKGPEALFSFLADRVDSSDKQAAALIYRLCMMAEKPGFRLGAQVLSDLGMHLDKESAPMQETYARDQEPVYERSREVYPAADRRQGPVFAEEETDIPDENFPGKGSVGGRMRPVIPAAVAGAGMLFLLSVRFLELEESRLLLACAFGGILMAAGVTLLIVQLLRGGEKQTERAPETEAEPVYTGPEPWETAAFSSGAVTGGGSFYGNTDLFGTGMRAVPESVSYGCAAPEPAFRPSAAPGETSLLGPDTRPAAGLYGTGVCRGEQISLAGLPCVVGKMQDYVDQVLDDSSVSRMHARFSLDRDGRISVRDLNSTNGTWLNGERLRPNESRSLQQGDHLLFGRMEFVFR